MHAFLNNHDEAEADFRFPPLPPHPISAAATAGWCILWTSDGLTSWAAPF